ncbi:hypothetical protein V493_02719 [Pseudogymnoascus sp. VKM F-4281 (FW-2241)]|nr:hypothetical protein V493_02719 [Pseudogymnoascus sp. VKM F-4281 (FW-2241)]
MNKVQEERQGLRDLGIVFVKAIRPEEFPRHLLKTFQNIRSFRKFDLSTFDSSDPSVLPEQVIWRNKITDRARKIVKIAENLIEDAPSEMEVRFNLEQKVLSRFSKIIECPSTACNGRLWRSEVEAEVEFHGRIAESLKTRRRARTSCQCSPGKRTLDFNTIFSRRADEMIDKNDSEERVKSRRPDRIIGFQDTGSFRNRLEKYNLMAGRLEKEAGLETIWETVKSTVLNHKGNSLFFPFLVIEAKSRIGKSFDDCNIQTALPILKMLKIQEGLQRESQMALEYGGPLVWYISYRSEDWRLSACYISEKPDGPSYEIVTLWTGQLNDLESTLQLLLIIDYIFDWARDIYRPSLISQLERLAKAPPEDDDRTRDDDITRIEADNDIFSLADPKQSLAGVKKLSVIKDWGAALEHDTEIVLDEERDLKKWVTHDSKIGVFRPAYTVQNLFRCLFVTKANIDAFYSTATNQSAKNRLAKGALYALDRHSTVLVSEDVLDTLEELWTNRARPKSAQHSVETRFFASIVYHTVVTTHWALQRIIYCLVFDAEALNQVKSFTPRKSPPMPFKYAKNFTKSNAEALIGSLQNQSIQQNLASALASTRQVLQEIGVGTLLPNSCATFEFVDIPYYKPSWGSIETYELIDKVYRSCEKNSEEPTEPFLRISHQWKSLIGNATGSTVASYFPNSAPATDEQYVLVAQVCPNGWENLCIYVIPGLTEATERLGKILHNAAKIDVLYKYSLKSQSNNWKDVYKKWWTTDSGSCQRAIKEFQRWRAEVQDKLPGSLSVVTEAESNLKRPRENAESNDALTIQKRVKSSVIIIDD